MIALNSFNRYVNRLVTSLDVIKRVCLYHKLKKLDSTSDLHFSMYKLKKKNLDEHINFVFEKEVPGYDIVIMKKVIENKLNRHQTGNFFLPKKLVRKYERIFLRISRQE